MGEVPQADHVFDGGAMDCGSGLILLIRQNMLEVPVGGILEIRSNEPTVESELPPWCRMVGHLHVGTTQVDQGTWRHWIRRGDDTQSERSTLEADKQKAQAFKWSMRARRTTDLETTLYSRNFSWKSATSIDFDRTGKLPSSLEQFLGSLLSDVINCLALRCSRRGIVLDELEGTLNATLNNTLAAVGMEAEEASVKKINLAIYVTTPAADEEMRGIMDLATADSAAYGTLRKACDLESRLILL